LVVEVDGSIHDLPDQKKYDAVRTEFMSDEQINVLRFTNSEIIDNLRQVLVKLEEFKYLFNSDF